MKARAGTAQSPAATCCRTAHINRKKMKFIHTADWHLGNRMHDIDRTFEVKAFFEWLRGEIVLENAEALVVAGDIFDTVNPSTEAKTIFHDFLFSLLGTCCKNVVIVGGNHDSGMLLDSEKSLLSALNIFIVGSAANLKIEDMVFELKNSEGEVRAVCAAVPFLRESELREFCDENSEDGTFCDKAYGNFYKKVYEEAEKVRAGRNIPLIATGHLYAADLEGRFENVKKEISGDDGRKMLDVVGKLGSVHAGIFPKEFDYVALGHIHYSTRVCKNNKIRYSGSPFVMGFDEANIARFVLSVNAEKNSTEVEKIEIPKTVEFRRLNGDFLTIRKELEKYLDKKTTVETFLELYYKKEAGINIYDQLEELINSLEEKNVYVVNLRVQESENSGDFFNETYDMEEMAALKPEKIFENLILAKSRIETEGKTADEVEKEKNEIVKTYLPFFMETFAEMENEPEE